MKNKFLNLIPVVFFIGLVVFASYAFMPDNTPTPEPTPPPNFCKKICGVNLTTDAYLLSVEGDLYIVIVGDKSTSIIKK